MGAGLLSVLFQLIGAFGFCAAEGVGMNLAPLSNPLVIVGIALMGIALIVSLALKITISVKKIDCILVSVALKAALTVLIFTVLFLILFVTWPVITTL